MKVASTLVLTALAAAVLIGCDKTQPTAPKPDASKTEASATTATATTPAKPYPLDVCIVAGEKLGSMGAPVVYVHEGQEVKFCCKGCLPDFKKEPAKYLAKLAPKK